MFKNVKQLSCKSAKTIDKWKHFKELVENLDRAFRTQGRFG